MTTKEYELEALRQLEGLTRVASNVMIQMKMNEWIEQPGGIDRLHQWFLDHPHWYNLDHIKPTINNKEENKDDRTTEAGLN